ncbi:MAG: efflux RND transporter periplasmic adaptor subunit [Rikenellaceae bacterium]
MITNFKRLSVLLLSSLILASCGGQQQQQTAPPVAEYQMLTISTSTCDITRPSSATIRGRQDVDVYPQVGGALTSLLVKEGDAVRKGETMFVIDQIPYRAALATAEANVASARASLATAKLTLESKGKLFQAKVISEFDYQTAKNAALVAEAQLSQANAQLENAENNLSFTTVKSPVDGTIGTLPYRVGALVSSAMAAPLTTVSDNSTMYVYFSMSESELLSTIREYGSREAALESYPAVALQLSDGSTYEHLGSVNSMSGVIDRSTGTITLRADFENPEGLLHSGASGNIIIQTQREDVVVIPQAVTFEIQDKVFVYKAVDGVAKSVMVDVTKVTGGKDFIVNSGLEVGDQIIAEGVGLLREGTPVRAKAATPVK